MLKYKGYLGKVEIDEEAGILYGEVINICDVITFEGQTVAEIQTAFRESIDDYLAFCAARGESPEQPSVSKFLVRSPALQGKLEDKIPNIWVNGSPFQEAKIIKNPFRVGF